ncbi:MAG: hypothetical protein PSN36_00710 [Gammaproteobacteria bacterium]|nr:hypothetical protein [Gammaproteobacteria bacterium]
METITIQKQELKALIKETLNEYFPKYEFISNAEQAEIEALYQEHTFDKAIDSEEFIEL